MIEIKKAFEQDIALANALAITIERPFDLHYGAMCGVIG